MDYQEDSCALAVDLQGFTLMNHGAGLESVVREPSSELGNPKSDLILYMKIHCSGRYLPFTVIMCYIQLRENVLVTKETYSTFTAESQMFTVLQVSDSSNAHTGSMIWQCCKVIQSHIGLTATLLSI